MSTKTLLTSIFCGLILLLAQPMSMTAATPTLAGSWQFTLTPTTPPTPTSTVPGLATFTKDGSVIETDGLEVAPGIASTVNGLGYGTPGHGIWQLLPCLCGYYVQYISLVVDTNGALHAKNTTTMTVTVSASSSGTQFSGAYTTVQVGPAGSVPKTTTGTVSGQLIPHPALP